MGRSVWENLGLHKRRSGLRIVQPTVVMAGLVPAIHAAPLEEAFELGAFRAAWMAGTSPAMTGGDRGCRVRVANLGTIDDER
jgi:hypothetical protein